MPSDPLQREYGILLGTLGPQLLDRIDDYKELAQVCENFGCPKAADYLRNQARRAEATIQALANGFENGST